MTAVRLHRTIAAPPATVWRAWLDPHTLARWMAPGDLTVTHADVDERVGGHYRIRHGDSGGFDAEILELTANRRLVLRWGFVGPQWRDGPAYDSLLTVTLTPADGGGTDLQLHHERLDDLAAAMPQIAAGVEPGWTQALTTLITEVTA